MTTGASLGSSVKVKPLESSTYVISCGESSDLACASVTVKVVLARTPAGSVPLRDNAMDAIRREETVVNALPQTVSVNWVAKIKVGVAVVISQRRGRHAKLICGRKVFEDVTPVGIFLGATAMTLVHND